MNSYIGFVITVVIYWISLKFKKIPCFSKVPPILFSAITIILILKFFDYDYSKYNQSASIITMILGPATVALAYPLVKNIGVMKQNKRAIWLGFVFATLVSVFSTYALGRLFGVDYSVIISMLPKSVTTPIAVEISKSVGGIPELTACVVILTGIVGGLSAHRLLKFLKIKNDIAIGLSVGASSHVLGTSRCIEKNNEKQAAISTLALIIVGLLTAIIVPIIVH